MISAVIRSAHNCDGRRWTLGVVTGFLCLAVWGQSQSRGDESRFFASKSASRASSVPGTSTRRVSLGRTPPSNAGRRFFTGGEVQRVVPANQIPGLRRFTGEMFTFGAFRAFGFRQAGATAATGASRVPQ
jgi:hypothetical protein